MTFASPDDDRPPQIWGFQESVLIREVWTVSQCPVSIALHWDEPWCPDYRGCPEYKGCPELLVSGRVVSGFLIYKGGPISGVPCCEFHIGVLSGCTQVLYGTKFPRHDIEKNTNFLATKNLSATLLNSIQRPRPSRIARS